MLTKLPREKSISLMNDINKSYQQGMLSMRELDKKEHFRKNRFSISPSRQYLVNRVASELEPIKPKGIQLVSPVRMMQQTTLPPITEEFGKKRNSFVHF